MNHDWDTPSYEWSSDNKSVTATRVCKNDATHKQTETANTTSEVTTQATCETVGEVTYTATFTNTAFAAQTKKAEIPATGHDWAAPEYKWADDNSSVTATRVCKNDATHSQTETASATSKVSKDATCTDKGETTYTSAAFDNEAFAVQTKIIANIDALGHKWGEATYTWADDYSSVTATRICIRDDSHVETETVDTTSAVTKPATCEAKGETTYTAAFTNTAFNSQTKTVENINALSHSWGEPTYTWSDDYSSVTAARVCANDATHKETETVAATYEVTKPATLTEAGVGTWTSAAFENDAFEVQKKDVAIPPTGYDITYGDWTETDDGWSITGTAVPYDASGETITETAIATYAVTSEPTCETAGIGTWTASFTDSKFSSQTKTVELPATGHAWGEVTYTWAADNSTVTATRICGNNTNHLETETVDTTSKITKPATCEDKGETTYTSASFENEAFKAQTKTAEDIAALGHDYKEVPNSAEAATCTAAGKEADQKCSRCDDVKTGATIAALGHDYKEVAGTGKAATCTEAGKEADQKCSRCSDMIEGAVIPKTGHSYGTPTYTWSSDNKSVTATRVCANDQSHKETETVSTTSTVTKQATCTAKGETTYTATFKNTAFATQTKKVEIPTTRHKLTKHAATDATCTKAGNSAYWSCDKCGKYFSDASGKTEIPKDSWVIKALGHDYKEVSGSAKTATCFEDGKKADQKCSRCGNVIKGAVIKANTGNCPSKPFKDVDTSKWYHEHVDYVLENNLMNGTSTTTFKPNDTITRAMVVTILYRMAGEPKVSGKPSYSDVPANKWFSDAIKWATDNGVATGYGNGKFGPSDPVTREQMATFLIRYAEYKGKDTSPVGSLNGYTDAGKVHSWAADAMKWAVGNGIITGKPNSILDPGGKASRAEFATIVHRYLDKFGK